MFSIGSFLFCCLPRIQLLHPLILFMLFCSCRRRLFLIHAETDPRTPGVARQRSAGAGHDMRSLPFDRLNLFPTLIHSCFAVLIYEFCLIDWVSSSWFTPSHLLFALHLFAFWSPQVVNIGHPFVFASIVVLCVHVKNLACIISMECINYQILLMWSLVWSFKDNKVD